jgi:hypothetical protein
LCRGMQEGQIAVTVHAGLVTPIPKDTTV